MVIKIEMEKKIFDLDQICAELEAIGESNSKKQPVESSSKSKNKSKPKRTKQKSPPKESIDDEVDLLGHNKVSQHTCLSGDTSSKILNVLPTKKTSSSASKCNANSRSNKTKKRFVAESIKCECDDESKFVHLDDIDHNLRSSHTQVARSLVCDKSCCFDIIDYWNRLLEEDEEAAKQRKVTPRRLKLNYVESQIEAESITDEEKREYFENRARYLAMRIEKRQELLRNWNILASSQQFKLIAKTTAN